MYVKYFICMQNIYQVFYFKYIIILIGLQIIEEWSPCRVVDNTLDCDNVQSKFGLQFWHYVHFKTNNLWKGMNPLLFTPPLLGHRLKSTITVFLQGWVWY